MNGDSDSVGKAILPRDLDRVLGLRFFSRSQMCVKADLTEEESEAAISVLIRMGFIEPWDAVRCPKCKYTWPEAHHGEDLPHSLSCPICGHSFKPSWSYRVYKMLRPLPNGED